MKKRIGIIACVCAFSALLVSARQVSESARCALSLCAELLIPSLFPFFVMSVLLNRMGFPAWLGRLLQPTLGRLLGVSGAGVSAFVIGLCGGYPMGAAYIADMLHSGHIGEEEAERLLCFCNNSGPAFIISAVGTGVFSSPAAGALLYLIHILAALICGIVTKGAATEYKRSNVHIETLSLSAALPGAVRQAVISVLNVCGFALCFTVLSSLLQSGSLFPLLCGRLSELTGLELTWWSALFTGLLELGSAAGAMRGLAPRPINLALAAGLLGWGGVSVHFQTMALLSESKAKGALHTAGRLMNASVSAVLAYFIAALV